MPEAPIAGSMLRFDRKAIFMDGEPLFIEDIQGPYAEKHIAGRYT
jgi:hypothetical protein